MSPIRIVSLPDLSHLNNTTLIFYDCQRCPYISFSLDFRPFHHHRHRGVILLFPPPLSSASLSPHTLLYNYLLVDTLFYIFFFFNYFQPLSKFFIVLGYINSSPSSLLPHFFGFQYFYRPAFFQHFFEYQYIHCPAFFQNLILISMYFTLHMVLSSYAYVE